jgi:hypothetical protein
MRMEDERVSQHVVGWLRRAGGVFGGVSFGGAVFPLEGHCTALHRGVLMYIHIHDTADRHDGWRRA